MKAEVININKLLGKPLEIDEVTYRYEQFSGGMSEAETDVVVNRRDAVAAVVYNTDTRQFIFANQFRYPVRGESTGWLTEIMAGVIDEGETPEQALAREMEEELGYIPEKAEKVVSFYTAPGYSKEQVHLYYVEVSNASKKGDGGGLAEEQEDIQEITYTLEEIKAIIAAAGFNDAKTIIACYYLLNKSIV